MTTSPSTKRLEAIQAEANEAAIKAIETALEYTTNAAEAISYAIGAAMRNGREEATGELRLVLEQVENAKEALEDIRTENR